MQLKSQLNTPAKPNKDQLSKVLYDFYQKPIAQVSSELFFTIGAIIFFAIFAIKPTIVTMTDLIKEIEDKRTTSEALTKKVTALSTVQTEYYTLQDQFPALEEVIPVVPNADRFLQILEKVASENRLSITSLQMKEVPQIPESTTADFSKLQPNSSVVTLSISGEYEGMKSFIKTINTSQPLMTVDSISFTNSKKSDSTLGLVATINLQIHYYSSKSDVKEVTEQQQTEDIPL